MCLFIRLSMVHVTGTLALYWTDVLRTLYKAGHTRWPQNVFTIDLYSTSLCDSENTDFIQLEKRFHLSCTYFESVLLFLVCIHHRALERSVQYDWRHFLNTTLIFNSSLEDPSMALVGCLWWEMKSEVNRRLILYGQNKSIVLWRFFCF